MHRLFRSKRLPPQSSIRPHDGESRVPSRVPSEDNAKSLPNITAPSSLPSQTSIGSRNRRSKTPLKEPLGDSSSSPPNSDPSNHLAPQSPARSQHDRSRSPLKVPSTSSPRSSPDTAPSNGSPRQGSTGSQSGKSKPLSRASSRGDSKSPSSATRPNSLAPQGSGPLSRKSKTPSRASYGSPLNTTAVPYAEIDHAIRGQSSGDSSPPATLQHFFIRDFDGWVGLNLLHPQKARFKALKAILDLSMRLLGTQESKGILCAIGEKADYAAKWEDKHPVKQRLEFFLSKLRVGFPNLELNDVPAEEAAWLPNEAYRQVKTREWDPMLAGKLVVNKTSLENLIDCSEEASDAGNNSKLRSDAQDNADKLKFIMTLKIAHALADLFVCFLTGRVIAGGRHGADWEARVLGGRVEAFIDYGYLPPQRQAGRLYLINDKGAFEIDIRHTAGQAFPFPPKLYERPPTLYDELSTTLETTDVYRLSHMRPDARRAVIKDRCRPQTVHTRHLRALNAWVERKKSEIAH
ncbi:hypothetical protein ANO14919_099720 [Xylariales sp. No.14919]|nr:hypothetical protein ANO14919_099720 [Xylariales sp. No.14919]